MISKLHLALLAALCFGLAKLHDAAAQPLPDRRALTGRVVREDGAPIGGAVVALHRQDDRAVAVFWGARVVTDARGEFTIPDAEEGEYYLSAEATGFTQEQNKPFTLDAATPPVQITLARLAQLGVRILRPDGTPLRNANVAAHLRGDKPFLQRFPRLLTDDDGVAWLRNQDRLVPSVYSLRVIAPGAGVALVSGLDVRYSDNPQPVTVQLQASGTLRVTAREAAPGNRPLGGGMFLLNAPDDNAPEGGAPEVAVPEPIKQFNEMALYGMYKDRSQFVTRDGDGMVELADLLPGRYVVRPFMPGYAAPPAQTVTVAASATQELTFAFEPHDAVSKLELAVVDPKGQPVGNAEVWLQFRLIPHLGASTEEATLGTPPPPPEAPPGMPAAWQGGPVRRVRTGPDGHATLYPVPLGKWRLLLTQLKDNKPLQGFSIADAEVTATGGSATIRTRLPKDR